MTGYKFPGDPKKFSLDRIKLFKITFRDTSLVFLNKLIETDCVTFLYTGNTRPNKRDPKRTIYEKVWNLGFEPLAPSPGPVQKISSSLAVPYPDKIIRFLAPAAYMLTILGRPQF
jgi:hypothetical protein